MSDDASQDESTADGALVDLRCSTVVVHNREFLLIRRGSDDWVLPGGRPRDGESMASCARRETYEETGLHVIPGRCAFVGEVIAPDRRTRVVDLVFLASVSVAQYESPTVGEAGTTPQWVGVDQLQTLQLNPPIAGFLASLSTGGGRTAPYLGNLWRPGRAGVQSAGQ